MRCEGLIYQQSFRQLQRALQEYRKVLQLEEEQPGLIPPETLQEFKIRECDLIRAMIMNGDTGLEDDEDELTCWLEGYRMFPDSKVIANELGNTYVEVEVM